jgi:putative solute:sodium symporter small subunit
MTDSPETESTPERDSAQGTQTEINFFKPHSGYAKDNKRLITVLLLIWAVAIFGFQALLLIMQKPTPEPNHKAFVSVWASIKADNASSEQHKQFTRVALSVLGKNIVVKPPHKDMLRQALSASVFHLVPGPIQGEFQAQLAQADKAPATATAIAAIGLEDNGFDKLMRGLLPTSLVKVDGSALSARIQEEMPGIMDLYLIHNRSVLTDFRFFGFPFHYWFTAQFLLILFVGMCFAYAKMINRVMIKHGRITREKV